MASSDVQLQHTYVSAAGTIESSHVSTLLEALGRKVNVPPTAFVARETYLRRSDDEAAAETEMADSRWSNVRRSREQTRITVRTEKGATHMVLPLPPAPPGAAPSVLVRSVVLVQDCTPAVEAAPLPPLEGVAVFATPPQALGERAVHCQGWDELVRLLNWTPMHEEILYGMRYVLLSDDPLVLNELRVYRTVPWSLDKNEAGEQTRPVMHVRVLSSFRSDVGFGVPKRQQDIAAAALQYAIGHIQQLQKALDAIVPLTRDV